MTEYNTEFDAANWAFVKVVCPVQSVIFGVVKMIEANPIIPTATTIDPLQYMSFNMIDPATPGATDKD
jgi:hypothetical protein